MSLLIRIIAIFLLVGFCDIFVFFSKLGSFGSEPVRKLIFSSLWAFSYAITAVGSINRKPLFISWRLAWVIGLGIYVLISLSWSTIQSRPYDLVFGFLGTLFAALFFTRSLSEKWTLETLRNIINLAAACSLILYLIRAPIAIYVDALARPNAFGLAPMIGVFSHKVSCAFICSIGVVLNLSNLRNSRIYSSTWILVCGCCVLFSGSATGILLLLIAIAIWATGAAGSAIHSTLGKAFVTLSCGTLILAGTIFRSSVLESVGRDAGMTGRQGIWEVAWLLINDRPLLGWGYQSIITKDAGGPFFQYYRVVYYTPVHLQNSYLQTAAELGIVGIILVGTMIIVAALINLFRMSGEYYSVSLPILSIVVLIAVEASVEQVFIGNSIGLFFVTWAFLCSPKNYDKYLEGLVSNPKNKAIFANGGISVNDSQHLPES